MVRTIIVQFSVSESKQASLSARYVNRMKLLTLCVWDSQDMVLCRSFRGLQKRINKEGGLKCQIKYWGGAWEVEEIFDRL